jgi:hypothetical protein
MPFVSEKINEAQRQEILRVYMEEGTDAAGALCISLGLCLRYYSRLASERGVVRRKVRPLTSAQKAKARSIVHKDDSHDHRWAWAIARGPVVV